MSTNTNKSTTNTTTNTSKPIPLTPQQIINSCDTIAELQYVLKTEIGPLHTTIGNTKYLDKVIKALSKNDFGLVFILATQGKAKSKNKDCIKAWDDFLQYAVIAQTKFY